MLIASFLFASALYTVPGQLGRSNTTAEVAFIAVLRSQNITTTSITSPPQFSDEAIEAFKKYFCTEDEIKNNDDQTIVIAKFTQLLATHSLAYQPFLPDTKNAIYRMIMIYADTQGQNITTLELLQRMKAEYQHETRDSNTVFEFPYEITLQQLQNAPKKASTSEGSNASTKKQPEKNGYCIVS